MSEKIVTLNEEVIKGQIKELVRGSVEETLNELLEAEAENGFCNGKSHDGIIREKTILRKEFKVLRLDVVPLKAGTYDVTNHRT